MWGSNAPPRGGSGAMPAAPDAKLDKEAMSEVLGRGRPAPASHEHKGSASPAQRPTGATSYASMLGVRRDAGPATHVGQGSAPAGSSVSATPRRQPFDAYVVLDFEATCEAGRRMPDQEIIEFPFVVIDPDTLRVVAEFQRYVRPTRNRQLSAFCTELTGITQATVDRADTFPVVLAEAMRYLHDTLGLGDAPPARSYCVVTCGDWDLQSMLPAQLRLCAGLDVPAGLQRWCNLKKLVRELPLPPPRVVGGHRGSRQAPRATGDLPALLSAVGLTLTGRYHSGIDDCRNIARVVLELMRGGHEVGPTGARVGSVHDVPRWRTDATAAAHLPSWDAVKSDLSPFTPTPPASPAPLTAAKAAAHVSGGDESHSGGKRSAPWSGGIAATRLPAVEPDLSRDAVAETLAAAPGARPLSPSELKTVSKALSFVLRHGADKVSIPVSVNGYARLRDLLAYGPLRNRRTTAADVAHVVSGNDKQRFRMVFSATAAPGDRDVVYVAATQGHSLEGVEPDLRVIATAEEVPDVVVHGTYWAAFEKIRAGGYLSVMGRHHIHFARGLPKDTGVISGMRASAQVVLYLDVARCLADGVPLLESANGVILTPGVGATGRLPLTYIRKAVNRAEGSEVPL